MAITMSEAAARHVQRSLEGRGKGEGIRLGVRTTGCSGLAYVLEFVDELAAEDQVFESHGVKVIIDPKSLVYLDGTELDFVKEGLNEGFKFTGGTGEGRTQQPGDDRNRPCRPVLLCRGLSPAVSGEESERLLRPARHRRRLPDLARRLRANAQR